MNKMFIALIAFAVILSLVYPVDADIGFNDTEVYCNVGNEIYNVTLAMNFSNIIITPDYVTFNNSGFYLSFSNNISIFIDYINGDISNANDGDKILSFYANTTETGWFNLSGFTVNRNWMIYEDGALFNIVLSNDSSYISFNDSIWNEEYIEIYLEGTPLADVTVVGGSSSVRHITIYDIIGLMGIFGILGLLLWKRKYRRR
jgi:hypothetical protein